MNEIVREDAVVGDGAKARLDLIDCDIHPYPRTRAELYQFLPKEWREHVETYGARGSQPFLGLMHIPRVQQARLDSKPETGPAGSDLKLMQEQLLDFYDIKYGILQPFGPGGAGNLLNWGLANAVCAAVNDWQIACWLEPEPRLRGSVLLPQEDWEASVKLIGRHAGDKRFAQITLHARSAEPLGKRRYWPIYEAAERLGLPVAIHSSGYGQYAPSGAGWMSFYIEEHHSYAHTMQTAIISMVMEGVFERFPSLKLVAVEGGFAWVPPLAWRLDKVWLRNRTETPHVKRPPSEYMRSNVWYATQPVEEPETPSQISDVIEWIGPDRLLFATDYPHWDMDDPRYAFKYPLDKEIRARIFSANAKELYGFA
ncbi:MAG: amidohydrolase [Hyphomicrobiaceae bacterium]|nr:amidohydrolase [Hyphomicrobiaceae bacterium]